MRTYKGKFTPKNKHKYSGDITKIRYLSLWERQAFRWCDGSPRVKYWSSEEVIIPYRYRVDGRVHRYHVDLLIQWEAGGTSLIEIKPDKETKPPATPKRKTKRYVKAVQTYIKNEDKWSAAKQWCEKNDVKWEIWTENSLKGMGIKLLK